MTHSTSGAAPAAVSGYSDPPASAVPPTGQPPKRAVSWWRRPWVLPLAVIAVAFVAFSLPPYLSFDPATSRVPEPGYRVHYPFLVAHVLFGSVALLSCGFQVWPWFRQRYPAAHRRIGRLYVFGGVLPAGVTGVVIGAISPFGPAVRVSNVLLALLWLVCTITGYRMARQRRFVDHRRWMIRSFALTASIITNRIYGAITAVVLWPQLATTFGGDEDELTRTIATIGAWSGWVVALLVAEWWLERGDMARRRAAAQRVDRPVRTHR
ncbi:DUF2306 domain-containing protein [Plantactinospora sp. S1510]|uniref:DUF2306 domain-containing protein n=1 Tax=Plantactinospora alkalitolerans TaxID=2789879 RepID=A0ABS0H543_9ACTN|nr:DUF2306 domain-containing protein [Plantactinospora alkalitolerans]MBF9133441.1 DUF2306 domain-containing protein [Plantactinospora alkalitolerans]